MEFYIEMSSLYSDENPAADGRKAVCCTDMEQTRCYCSAESYEKLRRRISDVPLNAVHHIDTGDFHYLTGLFLERIDEPFELLLFDNHSDTQPLAFEEPGMVSCGSWVAKALGSNGMLRSVWSFGVGGARSEVESAGQRAADCPLPVYISVDLDVLSPDEFSANWDQGAMRYEELAQTITECAAGRKVIGADICGGTTLQQAMSCESAPALALSRNRDLRVRLAGFLSGTVL